MFTNGVNLHVVMTGAQDGPLVILLHGFPEFWYGWRKQMPALAAAGYAVWAPDQRGYNRSDKPAGVGAYHIDTLADDIAGLIAASGREQVYLVGHDWGAAVAWWVAGKYPTRIKKLAILNVPHPAVMRRAVLEDAEQRKRSWYIFTQCATFCRVIHRVFSSYNRDSESTIGTKESTQWIETILSSWCTVWYVNTTRQL